MLLPPFEVGGKWISSWPGRFSDFVYCSCYHAFCFMVMPITCLARERIQFLVFIVPKGYLTDLTWISEWVRATEARMQAQLQFWFCSFAEFILSHLARFRASFLLLLHLLFSFLFLLFAFLLLFFLKIYLLCVFCVFFVNICVQCVFSCL